MMNHSLGRRTFLRGLGTAMALPLLDAMAPATARAAAAAAKHPKRMAFLFIPNGAHMQTWTPEKVGADYELPFSLEPLKNVKDDLLVITGLAQHNAFALQDGAGDHARSTASFLTGCHPRKTDGADIQNGISVDQFAAQHLGKETRFPSLELGCERGAQAGNCDSGYSCAYSSSIAWRSPTTPVAKEVDPRLVFERLFSSGDPNESAEARAKRMRYRQSILDLVSEDAKQLKGTLGRNDQNKLDEYFTAVREIEVRIARVEKDPELRIDGIKKPSGIPADYGDHLKLMADMMVLAFQSDLTRISTFMLANDGSNRPYPMIGISDGHHDLSHHQGDPAKWEKLKKINRFHLESYAYLLERLKSIKEGEGTLLDNCMIVYGAGISDGNRHNHDNLPVLLAGKGGNTIKSGRHIKFDQETPMNNLFMSMLDRLEVPCVSLGDSTGRLSQLT